MPFAKLGRREARERIDRYLSQRSSWMGYDLTLLNTRELTAQTLMEAFDEMGIISDTYL
jgi:hypothetical protein